MDPLQSLSPRDNLAVSDRSLGTEDADRCRLKAGVTASASTDSNGFSLGIRHRF